MAYLKVILANFFFLNFTFLFKESDNKSKPECDQLYAIDHLTLLVKNAEQVFLNVNHK
jgi:hypothetical protein